MTYFPDRQVPGIGELLDLAGISEDPRVESTEEVFHPANRILEFSLLQGHSEAAGYRLSYFPFSAVAHLDPLEDAEEWHRTAKLRARTLLSSLDNPARNILEIEEAAVLVLESPTGEAYYSVSQANPFQEDVSLVFRERSRTLYTFVSGQGGERFPPFAFLAKPAVPLAQGGLPGGALPPPPIDGPGAPGLPPVPSPAPEFPPPTEDFPIYPIPEPAGLILIFTVLAIGGLLAGTRPRRG